jgi:diacylglycerol O-acyltransferase
LTRGREPPSGSRRALGYGCRRQSMATTERVPYFEDLQPADAFFLYAERPETPTHIGAVYLFEATPRVAGGRGAQGIRDTIAERLHLVPRYRQRVRFRPFNLGHPVWVDDADFDLDHHVRRVAVPPPGDEAALRELAAAIFARPLDRARPLWELHVLEGLVEDRVALVSKVHHAMVDGISTLDMATLIFDAEPEAPLIEPQPWIPRPAPDGLVLVEDSLQGLRGLARLVPPIVPPTQLPGLALSLTRRAADLPRRARSVLQHGVEELMGTPWAGAAALVRSLLVPGDALFFNRRLGPRRRVRHLWLPLPALKAAKDVFGGTVNDVVLALVAEAIRGWLVERGGPVPERMRIMCPVSVRDEAHRYQLGNRVSAMFVEVPLGQMPVVTRLVRISARTGDLKRTRQAVAAQSLISATRWAPATLHALGTRLILRPGFGLQSMVNLTVTNVPGPQFPFYTGGARLLEVWPLVPIYHMLGLGVALVSYDGRIHIGLNADADLVPDLDRFAYHLGQASEALDVSVRAVRGTQRMAGRRSAIRGGGPGSVRARRTRPG